MLSWTAPSNVAIPDILDELAAILPITVAPTPRVSNTLTLLCFNSTPLDPSSSISLPRFFNLPVPTSLIKLLSSSSYISKSPELPHFALTWS